MAGLQYWVMYSQIARPYISGLFFSMLMVWCWSNLLFNTDSKKRKWWIGYVISSALCAYDHHFALLFAATVGLSGLFFIKRGNWKSYLLAGVSIFILYIPHLGIFYYQLSIGGVGSWLGKPDTDWLVNFIKYVFHFSYWIYSLVGLLVVISFFLVVEDRKHLQHFRIISISWFLLQFFIGYFYSIFVNPLLQFSTLIFVSPFFIMFLFSLFKEINFTNKGIVVTAILLTTVLSLVFERRHYEIFYGQPFEQFATNTFSIQDRQTDKINGNNNITIDLFLPPSFKEYYFKKFNRSFDYTFYNEYEHEFEPAKFLNFVTNQTTDFFITGNLPLAYIQIVQETYPYILEKKEGFTYSFYCFSKRKTDDIVHEKYLFSNKEIYDSKDAKYFVCDSSKLMFYAGRGNDSLENNDDYPMGFCSLNLKDVLTSKYNIINISMDITTNDSMANPILICDLRVDNLSTDKSIVELKQFSNNNKTTRVFLSKMIIKDALATVSNVTLVAWVENENKNKIKLNDFSMEVIQSNPFVYGLFEPIE